VNAPSIQIIREVMFSFGNGQIGLTNTFIMKTFDNATMDIQAHGNFHALLTAPGRSPEIPREADAYGWLVGSWELECLRYAGVDLSGRPLAGEAHFGWVLEGRAVQDVWIMPRVADRTDGLGKNMNMYGTTLRVWDSSIQAWRITWSNPAGNHFEEQIGRRSGKDVVQIGTRADGTPTRWSFTEITSDSFHWLGEALQPDGRTWRLEGEFLATRMSG